MRVRLKQQANECKTSLYQYVTAVDCDDTSAAGLTTSETHSITQLSMTSLQELLRTMITHWQQKLCKARHRYQILTIENGNRNTRSPDVLQYQAKIKSAINLAAVDYSYLFRFRHVLECGKYRPIEIEQSSHAKIRKGQRRLSRDVCKLKHSDASTAIT